MSDKKSKPVRCEGWRRYGGAFTLGSPRWEQCGNDATVMLEITHPGGQRWMWHWSGMQAYNNHDQENLAGISRQRLVVVG